MSDAKPGVLTPAAIAAAPAPGTQVDPAWLNPRLEQAQRSAREALLAELGVTDVAAAKAAVTAAAAATAASKTAEQRAAELETQVKASQTNESRLAAAVAEYAARQMVGLTPEQKAAVEAIAGNDAAAQVKAISALQPTWAATTALATDAAKAAPPATTAPAGGAPPPAGTLSQPDHKSVYTAMNAVNPFAAARYGEEHPEVYGFKS